MTGLHPAREFHTALFDISSDTLAQAAKAALLLAAGLLLWLFFSELFLPSVLASVIVAMVVEFFSDLHKSNQWADD